MSSLFKMCGSKTTFQSLYIYIYGLTEAHLKALLSYKITSGISLIGGVFFTQKGKSMENITLLGTDSSPLKIGHPKRKPVFQPSIFRCKLAVSFREGRSIFFLLKSWGKKTHQNPINQHLQRGAKWFLKGVTSPSLRV